MADSVSPLAAIHQRAEQATPGPWQVVETDDDSEEHGVIAVDGQPGRVYICEGFQQPAEDAEFVAHAREDIPYLLALLSQLHEEHRRLKEGTPSPVTPGAENLDGALTIRFLQYINAKRAERWHGLKSWSALEWAGAMAGEAGEACNAAKKLKRIEDQIANINLEDGRSLTDRETACSKIVDEIADTVIYGVLLAERVGLDLEEAIRMKFNRKSEEYGFPERIEPPAAALLPRWQGEQKETKESPSRVDGVPEGAHGDLPRPAPGDN